MSSPPMPIANSATSNNTWNVLAWAILWLRVSCTNSTPGLVLQTPPEELKQNSSSEVWHQKLFLKSVYIQNNSCWFYIQWVRLWMNLRSVRVASTSSDWGCGWTSSDGHKACHLPVSFLNLIWRSWTVYFDLTERLNSRLRSLESTDYLLWKKVVFCCVRNSQVAFLWQLDT